MSDPSVAYARVNLWQRVPLVVRAVIMGFLVTQGGLLLPWAAVLIPLPRSVRLGGVSVVPLFYLLVLVLYLLFFSGRLFWPATKQYRREHFRAVSLAPSVWKWGLAAAGLFIVAMEACFFTLFRLLPFPAEQFARPVMLEGLSPVQLWFAAIAASIFAGVCEETGFRGYLQRPLEQAYGPGVAIAVTTVAFAALHLNQPWVVTLLVPILLAGVLLGMLAYAARSLIPGIIGHALMDVFNFSYWWWSLFAHYDRQTIWHTGIDLDFLLWSTILAASLALFLLAIHQLAGARPPEKGASPAASL